MTEPAMADDRRTNFRVPWNLPAVIDPYDGPVSPCMVVDLSNTGAKLSAVKAATLPDEFALRMTIAIRLFRRCRVVWRTRNEVGVEFVQSRTIAGRPVPQRRQLPVRA